jgi:CHAT domain-containing protein/tetratricopeptide (TPR) repeat protein
MSLVPKFCTRIAPICQARSVERLPGSGPSLDVGLQPQNSPVDPTIRRVAPLSSKSLENPPPGFRQWVAAILSLLVISAAWPSEGQAQASGDSVQEISRKAEELVANGNSEEAIIFVKDALAKVEISAGAGDSDTLSLMNILGLTYAQAGRYDDAASTFGRALEIVKNKPEIPVRFRLNLLSNRLEALVKLAKHEEALPLSQELLATAEKELGVENERTNTIRGTLVKIYITAKRPLEAISIARDALRYSEIIHGADHPETIHERTTLAVALMETSHYEEAKKILETALDIAQRRLPHDHEHLTAINGFLSNVNRLLGRTADAKKYSDDATKGSRAKAGMRDADLAIIKNNQALQEQTERRYESAETLFLKAIELSKKGRPDHPETAATLANLSGLYSLWGRYADAERVAQESLAITQKNPGPGTAAEAKGMNTIALIHVKTGRYEEAIPWLRAAFKICMAKLEPGHPDTIFVFANLAGVESALGNHKEAAELGEIVLASIEKRFGPKNRNCAIILMNLGQSYTSLKNYEKAEPLLLRAVSILENEPGPPSTELATAYNAIGQLRQMKGQWDESESSIRKTIEILEQSLGPNHPETTVAIDNLATMLLAAGRWREAAKEFDRTRRSRREFLAKTLFAMPEADQYKLVDMSERLSLDGAMSLAISRRMEPEIASRSAEWMLNSKAITIRALAQRALLSREEDNPEAAKIVAELDHVRGKLARMAMARDVPSPTASNDDYKALIERDRQLGLALRIPSTIDPWTSLDAVRDSLPEDAVLVEFGRFRIITPAKVAGGLGWEPARYVAWVIPPKSLGEVRLVDLGPAEEIEAAVAEVLRGLHAPPDVGGEAKAEQTLSIPLQLLAEKVLKPLEGYLGPAKRWVLSPDAALWLVPWAALPEKKGRYAVEGHLIHLVVSGRELTVKPSGEKANAPAILADPDYDLGVGRAFAKARELGRVRGGSTASSRGARIRSESLGDTFGRLQGTGDEARAIAPLMKIIAGVEPEVFVEAAASETVFKALRSPKILVLSTHGFFLEDPKNDPAEKTPGSETRSLPANPLLRSGLILAGYNRALSVGEGDNDDGLVTGLEVASCDLRATDLVVLSACETGLGKVRAGEGIAGLRQVFQLAGAKAVVASLWKVPDFESYQLMTTFFQSLSRGRGNAEALREAQLAMIADRRGRLGAAHPYYWAAFALTGFPGRSWRDEAVIGIDSSELPAIPKSRLEFAATMISPVTGLPEAGTPWGDSALALVLGTVGVVTGRWWWKVGGSRRY